jgi:hypothetical protein
MTWTPAQVANDRTVSTVWGIVLVAISAYLVRVAIRDCREWGRQRPFRRSFRILLWLPFFAWFWVVMSAPALSIPMAVGQWIFFGPFIAAMPFVLFGCGYLAFVIVQAILGMDSRLIGLNEVRGSMDYHDGVPRDALTTPTRWSQRHYRAARLRGFDYAEREEGRPDRGADTEDEPKSTDAQRASRRPLPIQVHLLWPDDVEGFTQMSNDVAFAGREGAAVLLQCLQTALTRFDGRGGCFECGKESISPGAFVVAFPDGIVEGTVDNATFFACCETCAAPLSEEEILARWAARWQSILYPD